MYRVLVGKYLEKKVIGRGGEMCRVWRRREIHTEFWWGNTSERSTWKI
jgi:hypothetical protein